MKILRTSIGWSLTATVLRVVTFHIPVNQAEIIGGAEGNDRTEHETIVRVRGARR